LGVSAFCLDFEPISGQMFITRSLGIPFMMQAWWLFVICSVIYFTISCFTPSPGPEIIEKYTWESPLAVFKRGKIKGISDPRILAGILILTMIILYIVF